MKREKEEEGMVLGGGERKSTYVHIVSLMHKFTHFHGTLEHTLNLT